MKRKIIFKKDGKITSEGEIDVRAGEYIVDGEVGSGGGGSAAQPDWNQNNPSAPDYVKNRPMSKTVTQQRINAGSGAYYVNTEENDNASYLAVNGDKLQIVESNYDESEDGIVYEKTDTVYTAVSSSANLYWYAIRGKCPDSSESYLTEVMYSFFIKPNEHFTDYSSMNLYIKEEMGWDDEVTEATVIEHADEVIALCDEYVYKVCGGVLLYYFDYYDENLEDYAEAAWLLSPSEGFRSYWNVVSEKSLVRLMYDGTNAEQKTPVWYFWICPYFLEIYPEPTGDDYNNYIQKSANTKLSDLGINWLYDEIITTTTYNKIDQNYIPAFLPTLVLNSEPNIEDAPKEKFKSELGITEEQFNDLWNGNYAYVQTPTMKAFLIPKNPMYFVGGNSSGAVEFVLSLGDISSQYGWKLYSSEGLSGLKYTFKYFERMG